MSPFYRGADRIKSALVDSFNHFAAALFPAVSLQTLDLGVDFPRSAALDALIPSLSSLKTLRLAYNAPSVLDFTSMTVLESVELGQNDDLADLTPFLPVASTLRSLTINSGMSNILGNISALVNLTALETFDTRLKLVPIVPFPSVLELPPNLSRLSLSYAPSTPFEIVATGNQLTDLSLVSNFGLDLIAIPSSLTSLYLYAANGYPSGLNFTFPPGLQTFTINGYLGNNFMINSSIQHCTQLTNLKFGLGADLSILIDALPSLRATNINKVELGANSNNVATLLCLLIPSSKLTSLHLSGGELPSCGLAQPFPALKDFGMTQYDYHTAAFNATLGLLPSTLISLSVSNFDVSAVDEVFNWDSFVAKFTHMERLSFETLPLGGTFPSQLKSLTSLQYLSLIFCSLAGPIPEDFFATSTKLTTFYLGQNAINGTFPWYGLQNIQEISVDYNQLESWPSVAGGAPNLVLVSMSQNALTEIPDDISFSEMPMLSSLNFFANPSLSGPLPGFWANHPSIAEVALASCNFSGTIPSTLLSPKLRELTIQENRLCGPIFDVPERRGLRNIDFGNNRFSGTFPASWGSHLSIIDNLNLGYNFMNGTLPSHLATSLGQPASISLNVNNFHGPVPDFFDFKTLVILRLSDTSLDLCASSPNLNVTSGMTCILDNVAVSACGCQELWQKCGIFCNTSPPPASVVEPEPAQVQCIIPPSRPTARPAPVAPSNPPPPPVSAAESAFVLQFSVLIVAIAIAVFSQ